MPSLLANRGQRKWSPRSDERRRRCGIREGGYGPAAAMAQRDAQHDGWASKCQSIEKGHKRQKGRTAKVLGKMSSERQSDVAANNCGGEKAVEL